MGTEFRNEINALIEERRNEYIEMSDVIWGYAEPRLLEFKSSRLQQEYLDTKGFRVKANLAGMETAFIAEYGSGKPVIGILGEFDVD